MIISRGLAAIHMLDNLLLILSLNRYIKGVVSYLEAYFPALSLIDLRGVNGLRYLVFPVTIRHMHYFTFIRLLFGDNEAISIREGVRPDSYICLLSRYKN